MLYFRYAGNRNGDPIASKKESSVIFYLKNITLRWANSPRNFVLNSKYNKGLQAD
jgi:hypothetical protein